MQHFDWTEKHRPRSLSELVGNSKAIEELRAWAESWRNGPPAKRAVILAGEPGIGKTSAAYALANDMGWGIVELNASDQRNEEIIRRIAGAGAVNRSLMDGFSEDRAARGRQLIFLDEADNLFGREDRGGMRAILETIRIAQQPIVLVANDYYELTRRGASLKSLAETIKFTKVHSRSIPPALRRIAEREGVKLDPGVPEAIAERADGDLRSAVNDLQALALGRTHVSAKDVETLGKRDEVGDVWRLLGKVFYGNNLEEARRAAWDLDETPENIALWIDENLPVMYTHRADLVEGYQRLSRADIFLGRVTRRQQYALWSYASELMTAGVALAKHDRPAGARFQFPSWLRKLSTSKAMREVRGRTAQKVANETHTSTRRAREDMFPVIRALARQDPDFGPWAVWHFGFEADELAFLLGVKATDAEVKRMIEAAEKRGPAPAPPQDTAFSAFGAGDDASATDGDDEADDPPQAATKKKTKRLTVDDDEDGDDDAQPSAPSKHADAKASSASPPEEPDARKKQKNLFEF